MNHLPPIILASASPRRSDLLRQMEYEFEVVPAEVVEIQSDQLTPREVSQVNAYRKARTVAQCYPDRLVLGADTVVALGPQVFGKPSSRAVAADMLSRLQGKEHEVVTGVCLIQLGAHRLRVFVDSTRVWFHSLTTEQIAEYLGRIDPLDKAGAYSIQDHGEMIVREIAGSFSNVVGLPSEQLERELEAWSKA